MQMLVGKVQQEINMILLSIHATDTTWIIFFVMMFNSTMESNDCSDMNDTFDFNWKRALSIKEAPVIPSVKKVLHI